MTRMIDADALKALSEAVDNITAVEKYLRSIGESWYADIMSDTEDILTVFAEDINVRKNGWTSVKDRLPEKSGTYLCFQPTVASICSLNTVRWSEAKGHWMGKEVGSRIEGIEYWMPLPEPPKEEEK